MLRRNISNAWSGTTCMSYCVSGTVGSYEVLVVLLVSTLGICENLRCFRNYYISTSGTVSYYWILGTLALPSHSLISYHSSHVTHDVNVPYHQILQLLGNVRILVDSLPASMQNLSSQSY